MGVGHRGQEAGLNRHHGFGWNRDLRRETRDVTRPSDCVSCELLLFLLSCFTLQHNLSEHKHLSAYFLFITGCQYVSD